MSFIAQLSSDRILADDQVDAKDLSNGWRMHPTEDNSVVGDLIPSEDLEPDDVLIVDGF